MWRAPTEEPGGVLWGKLRDRLQAAREEAYDRVEDVLGSSTSRGLMLDLVEWAHVGSWLADKDTDATRTMPARAFAGRALSRFRRKVKQGGRSLRGTDDEARHEVRKDAKKLRYAAEFFAPLYDRKGEKAQRKTFMNALEAVQGRLGR